MKASWWYFLLFICLWSSFTFIVSMLIFPEVLMIHTKETVGYKRNNAPMYTHTSFRTVLNRTNSVTAGILTTTKSLLHGQHNDRLIGRYESEILYFTPRSHKVNPMNAEFVIVNRGLCEDVIPYLLILIPSVHRNAEVRHAIRNTYGSKTLWNTDGNENVTVKLLFLFGKGTPKLDDDILQESRKYGDIVQVDFVDSYKNLTRKILYGLKWATLYCSEVEFVVKADEDVFINIPFLISYLQKTPFDRIGAVYGFINGDASVKRRGKWAVTVKAYPLRHYPPYASGNSYVISGNIIPRLFMVSEYMPYIPIEDAFITGFLTKIIGAKHNHNDGFTQWISDTPDPCKFVNESRLSATKVTISLFFKLWKAMQSNHIICKK